MSVINKMLQDLDRRQALGAGPDVAAVRPPSSSGQHREWFWRIVTLLLSIGVAWVLWIAYQLMPRPLVTDKAFRAAEDARGRVSLSATNVAPPAPVPPVAEPVPPAPAPVAAVTAPVPVAAPSAAPPASAAEPLKLALQIDTPVREPAATAAPPKPAPVRVRAAASPPAKALPEPEKKPTLDKRERKPDPAATAEIHFRRAALLLNQGRLSEAEAELVAALKSDAGHRPSRQAYVALLLDQQRVEQARPLLEDALAADAAQPAFALVLARIYAGQGEHARSLQVLDAAGPGAQAPEFHAMRGAVLQRLGRNEEAVRAFQAAIGAAPQPAATWVSLGISLEALGRPTEAADAYRKALGAGRLAAQAREYAEDRVRALQ